MDDRPIGGQLVLRPCQQSQQRTAANKHLAEGVQLGSNILQAGQSSQEYDSERLLEAEIAREFLAALALPIAGVPLRLRRTVCYPALKVTLLL
jgi:hypothetical protein